MTSSVEVQTRVTAFEDAWLAWLGEARPGVPTFVLPDAPTLRAPGTCLSCADPIESGLRCRQCIEAVERVLKDLAP